MEGGGVSFWGNERREAASGSWEWEPEPLPDLANLEAASGSGERTGRGTNRRETNRREMDGADVRMTMNHREYEHSVSSTCA